MGTSSSSLHSYNDKTISAPFEGLSVDEMCRKVERFMQETSLNNADTIYIYRGAFLAQDPNHYVARSDLQQSHTLDTIQLKPGQPPEIAPPNYNVTANGEVIIDDADELKSLNQENREVTVRAILPKWRGQSSTTYQLVLCCLLGAMVQGFDETACNGAQIFYQWKFNLDGQRETDQWLLGLINGAPYMISAFTCLLNDPLNVIFGGRRKLISFTCVLSFAACLGQAFVNSWQTLLVARCILGLGIGPKSATIPIYISECVQAQLRGSIVTMWQMWTAFGIFLGYLFGLVFLNVENACYAGGQYPECMGNSNNWKWMLASPMVVPLIPAVWVLFLPESPRYLLRAAHRADSNESRRNYVKAAFQSLEKLNNTRLQASRELFYLYHSLEGEKREGPGRWSLMLINMKELFTQQRSRHALVASIITLFMQQFCGVNVLTYYSTWVLNGISSISEAPSSNIFAFSLGFGAINFALAIPTVWLMDTFGRRSLLLTTFPFLAISQFIIGKAVGWTSVSNNISNRPMAIAGMYLFCVFYSIGEGPVPFLYASETMPLYHRDAGMGIVTSVNWLFNFILAFTWPHMLVAMNGEGAFIFYGAFCIVGWFLIFFFVRESKGLKLEAMGTMFRGPTTLYFDYAWRELRWFFRCCWHLHWGYQKPDFVRMVEHWDEQRQQRAEVEPNGYHLEEIPM